MDIIERDEWNARKPKANFSVMSSKPRGVKIHYTGGRVPTAIIEDHAVCFKQVRKIQDFHIDGNRWIDIGYSFVVCPHRCIFVGRGLGHLPAANGPGLNSGHYAILALVGNSGITKPNDEILKGIWDCIDYIRANTKTGKEIKGHRDGYATDCPGGPLYKWVQEGAKDIRNDER